MNKSFYIKKIKQSHIVNKVDKILEICQDKDVLDVGCIGQDFYYSNIEWLHNKIKNISKKLVGVDINKESIYELKKKQYIIYHKNELKDLRMKFDVIVISDVIEHVENPVQLLNHYSHFLKKMGKMIVTTPNPFSLRQTFNILLGNDISVNEEHTMWIDPRTFLEILNRTHLSLESFYWLYEYYKIDDLSVIKKILHYIYFLGYKIRKYYSPNLMFILT